MKNCLFYEVYNRTHKDYYMVELHFSCLMWVSGNPLWFCRIWKKDWLTYPSVKWCGESYGKNKFEAYRLALKDFNS